MPTNDTKEIQIQNLATSDSFNTLPNELKLHLYKGVFMKNYPIDDNGDFDESELGTDGFKIDDVDGIELTVKNGETTMALGNPVLETGKEYNYLAFILKNKLEVKHKHITTLNNLFLKATGLNGGNLPLHNILKDDDISTSIVNYRHEEGEIVTQEATQEISIYSRGNITTYSGYIPTEVTIKMGENPPIATIGSVEESENTFDTEYFYDMTDEPTADTFTNKIEDTSDNSMRFGWYLLDDDNVLAGSKENVTRMCLVTPIHKLKIDNNTGPLRFLLDASSSVSMDFFSDGSKIGCEKFGVDPLRVNVLVSTPEIKVTGDNPATVEVGSSYTDAGATAPDETVTSSGTVDTETIGTYTITYSADTNGNVGKTRTVNVTNVNDNAPVFTSSATFSAAENQTAIVPVVTATDADGGDSVTFAVSGSELQITPGGVLTFVEVPDHSPHTTTATVTASDGTNTTTQLITVQYGDRGGLEPSIIIQPNLCTQCVIPTGNNGESISTISATNL